MQGSTYSQAAVSNILTMDPYFAESKLKEYPKFEINNQIKLF